MAFTAEHDAFILMAHYRSATQDAEDSWSHSLPSCVVEDIRQRVERSPTKSVAKLSQQTGLSVETCHKALSKKIHMHPYKVTVVQQLHPLDYEKQTRFCEWFNDRMNDDLDLTFFSDEAWFHLTGYVNSQNYRTWATENPHQLVETVLHPLKVGIWVGMSRRRIIGPIFFYDTITAARYRDILNEFLNQLDDNELQNGWFQQDNAPAHTARDTHQYLSEFYDDRLFNLWPPRSPDLSPLDFYLFGYLKDKIYRNTLHDLQELEAAIVHEINNITQNDLHNVFENLNHRVNICLRQNGHHFQHLL